MKAYIAFVALCILILHVEAKCKKRILSCKKDDFKVMYHSGQPKDALKGCKKKELQMLAGDTKQYIIQPNGFSAFEISRKLCWQSKNVWSFKVNFQFAEDTVFGKGRQTKFIGDHKTSGWKKNCFSDDRVLDEINIQALPMDGQEDNMFIRKMSMKTCEATPWWK